jgi:hypothetical protein
MKSKLTIYGDVWLFFVVLGAGVVFSLSGLVFRVGSLYFDVICGVVHRRVMLGV